MSCGKKFDKVRAIFMAFSTWIPQTVQDQLSVAFTAAEPLHDLIASLKKEAAKYGGSLENKLRMWEAFQSYCEQFTETDLESGERLVYHTIYDFCLNDPNFFSSPEQQAELRDVIFNSPNGLYFLFTWLNRQCHSSAKSPMAFSNLLHAIVREASGEARELRVNLLPVMFNDPAAAALLVNHLAKKEGEPRRAIVLFMLKENLKSQDFSFYGSVGDKIAEICKYGGLAEGEDLDCYLDILLDLDAYPPGKASHSSVAYDILHAFLHSQTRLKAMTQKIAQMQVQPDRPFFVQSRSWYYTLGSFAIGEPARLALFSALRSKWEEYFQLRPDQKPDFSQVCDHPYVSIMATLARDNDPAAKAFVQAMYEQHSEDESPAWAEVKPEIRQALGLIPFHPYPTQKSKADPVVGGIMDKLYIQINSEEFDYKENVISYEESFSMPHHYTTKKSVDLSSIQKKWQVSDYEHVSLQDEIILPDKEKIFQLFKKTLDENPIKNIDWSKYINLPPIEDLNNTSPPTTE